MCFSQEFLCVPGYYPVDELCSEITFRFWDVLLVSLGRREEGGEDGAEGRYVTFDPTLRVHRSL